MSHSQDRTKLLLYDTHFNNGTFMTANSGSYGRNVHSERKSMQEELSCVPPIAVLFCFKSWEYFTLSQLYSLQQAAEFAFSYSFKAVLRH